MWSHAQAGDEAAATLPPPAVVAEGLLLWRRLLRCWAVYRRWLEVRVGRHARVLWSHHLHEALCPRPRNTLNSAPSRFLERP